MDKFYITYPYRMADKRSCYSVIEAPSYDEAVDLVCEAIGNAWAFIYTHDQFMGKAGIVKYPSQIEAYNLTEIPLEKS